MDFDFSDEDYTVKDAARRLLAAQSPPAAVRRVLDGQVLYLEPLWREIGALGWPAAAIPVDFGGIGLGHLALCCIAEELGRALAPVPMSSSIYLAAEAIVAFGTDAQKRALLPRLADGTTIGTFAVAEGGAADESGIAVTFRADGLRGSKTPVPDGSFADLAIVAARGPAGVGLYIADLRDPSVTRVPVDTLDPTRPHAALTFAATPAEPLGAPGTGWANLCTVRNRAAVLIAFEQVGIADACLAAAIAYAQQRRAYGRPIGSFQAIKHKLADVYVKNELARANAFYAAWALDRDAPELPGAAAAAHLAASDAALFAARESLQTHGGIGFTWDMDCHLYVRRAGLLALTLGGSAQWERQLVEELKAGRIS
jgi:alkylation response protein AidB-like acyl-CoA dehydrogenase